MKDIFKDDSAIAYSIIYIMMGIIFIGILWVSFEPVTQEFTLLTTDLAVHDMWGSKTSDAITDLNQIWNLILWLTVGTSMLYGIISAIRKERTEGI